MNRTGISDRVQRRERIEILHLVSTFAPKADTKWLVQLAHHVDTAKFRLTAACFYGDGSIRSQLEGLDVQTHNFSIEDERDLRAVLRARSLMQAGGFEIVHTHMLRADLLGGMAARLAKVPVIVSTVYAIGDFRRARRRRSDRILDAACNALPTQFVAVSEAVRHDCIERAGIAPDQVTVIRTGIDLPPRPEPEDVERFRRQHRIAANHRLVVTLARLSYEKGIDTLIDAATTLRRICPNVRLLVLGDGPDREALRRHIYELGLADIITLGGFHEDVWPALFASDIVCLPSKSEGMPNALLEAMAADRPIVATSVGGIPEALTHEENGLLVPPERPELLANAMGRLLDDAELARRLGQAARDTVETRFTAQQVARAYAHFYEMLLMRRRGKRAEPALSD